MTPQQLDAVATMIALFESNMPFHVTPEQVEAAKMLLRAYELMVAVGGKAVPMS